jgi:signal transduction histidine kinase
MQCLSNLLSNAVKFVAPGTTPRVRIWVEEANLTEANNENKKGISSSPSLPSSASVKIFIQDNGIGIAPENHARVFRMFERIHPVSAYDGTGIGLTIVRKASERMGAQVGFESQLGKGSTFWIQLAKG